MRGLKILYLLFLGCSCQPHIITPPPTLGSPDRSALVVVSGGVKAINFGQYQTVEKNVPLTGGMLQLEDQNKVFITGRIVQDVLLFSHLSPGFYQLENLNAPAVAAVQAMVPFTMNEKPMSVISTKAVRAGNQIKYTMPREIEEFRSSSSVELTFSVRPGQLLYIGKIMITDELRTNAFKQVSRNNDFSLVIDPYDEIITWEIILNNYPETAWTHLIETRLNELNFKLENQSDL